MAPTRKPAERRQRRATKDLEPSPPDTAEVVKAPAAPRGLLASTVEDWRAFWATPQLANAVQSTDRPALRRLFEMRDRQKRMASLAEDLRKKAVKTPMVEGSMGQQVANPLFRSAEAAASEALALEPRIVALEDRFGLTPRARLNLGVVEQTGLNLLARNEELAKLFKESAGAGDPRS